MTNATSSSSSSHHPSGMNIVGSLHDGTSSSYENHDALVCHDDKDNNDKKNVVPVDDESNLYANRHIPNFLRFTSNDNSNHNDNGNDNQSTPATKRKSTLQIVHDGRLLTAHELRKNHASSLSLSKPILVVDTPTSIGMQVPKGSSSRKHNKKGSSSSSSSQKLFTVRDLANIVGHHYPVSVIDVALQEELEGWTLEDLVDYFEDEDRHATGQRYASSSSSPSNHLPQSLVSTRCNRPRRRAADKACTLVDKQRPKVLNQISMEFSRTPLRQYVSSPQFVRELDWIDKIWPQELRDQEDYPVVQYYCLTSTGGCYTDFHVDFGGTAVWYHVLNGAKEFILIPPTDENLACYEDWLCRPNQAELFFPDMLSSKAGCVKVRLKATQTLVIPTGWIHGVYTPMDAVVLGGNFLHGLDMADQLKIYCLETRTRVQDRFRFPYFCPIMYYAGGHYLAEMKKGTICQREVDTLPDLINTLDSWWKVHSKESSSSSQTSNKKKKIVVTPATAARWAASKAGEASVEDMIASLRKEHDRLVKYGITPHSSSTLHNNKKKIKLKLKSSPPKKLKLKLKLGQSTTTTNNNNKGDGRIMNKNDVPTTVYVDTTVTTSETTTIARRDDDDANDNNNIDNANDSKNNQEFRINIPSSAMYGLPQKRKRARAREEIDAYANDPGDEEWKPKQGKKKKQRSILLSASTASTTTSMPSLQHHHQQQQARPRMSSTSSRPSKGGKNARQRLMKRFK